MKIVDTDVLIDYLRGRDPGASWAHRQLENGTRLMTTVLSRFELLAGARTSREIDSVDGLLAAIPALPLDTRGADQAAATRRALARQGSGIGMGDSLIAGIVIAAEGTLVTRNVRHFSRVAGLPVRTPD